MRTSVAATIGAAALVLASLFALAAPLRAAEPKVAVTIKPLHSLVSRIMAGVAEPDILVSGSASPHSFSLTPSAARAVANADILIRVSEDLEPFTRRLVANAPKTVEVVTVIDIPGLTVLPRRAGGGFEAHHDHHDHHEPGHDEDPSSAEGMVDPHVWLDPVNAKTIATALAGTLARRYPEHSDRFQANAATLAAEIDGLAKEITGTLEPVHKRPFIVFHDGTQYFERYFGLDAEGAISSNPAIAPGAQRLAAVRKSIREHGIVCVFAEPGAREGQMAAIVEGSSVRLGELDAEGQLLKAGPGLYDELMRKLAENFRSCLAPAHD